MTAFTAGTPADGYRAPYTPHPFRPPADADWGCRALCASCGRERHEHLIPHPRKASR